MPDATPPLGDTSGGNRSPVVAFPRTRDPERLSPNNLPLQLTSFVGREREIAEVKDLLADQRLLTLTGPGGCGKTRLALKVASDLAERFEDGVWLVELASLSDPALVPQTVAFALGIREQPGRLLTDTLSEYLELKKILLVLDNCEHLVEACARLAEALLRSCPNLRILATSREALGITGETGWLVPSLSLPDPRYLPTVEDLPRYEAARLFIERAAAMLPTFEPTDRNAAVVMRVCRGLDGIPLAIELAAARVKVLSVEQIAERLHDRFRLLTAGSRTALPRHRTLRATIDWSHDLLSEEEKVLFRRLSVFAGGFVVGATEAVCVGEDLEEDEVLDLLSHLVDKSLVIVQERGGEARYRLLETVRQYGWEKLEELGEAEAVRRRHAIFFLDLAEEVEPRIEPNVNIADRRPWLERLEVEHDNLRAALRWAQESNPQTGLRLGCALYWLWYHRGYWSEGRGWFERALVKAPALTAARSEALYYAGYLAWAQGDHPVARSRLEESVAIWRELGGGQGGLAHALWVLGLEMLARGEPAVARSLAEESVQIFRTIGDEFGLSISLANLGAIVLDQGDHALASSLLEESVEISRKAGDDWMLSLPLRNLGVVVFRQGDHDRAEALIKESLFLLRELGDKLYTSRGLECLAAVVSMRGDHGRAARLFGAGEALREAIGASVPFHLVDYDGAIAGARDTLGEEAFAAAWAQGREMTMEQAVAYALDEPSAVEAKTSPERLRIFALGPGQVERGGRALAPSEWTYAKSRELLFYLLGHPSCTKEQIGLALWPEASPSQLRSSFHRTLHHLRRALGRPEWISFENGRYSFNRSLDYWFDVEAFESELAEARRHGARAPERAIRNLEEAIDLYKGGFLEELAVAEGEWALERQEELRRLYGEALLDLGELLSEEGRYAEAAEAYRKAIAHDELLEAAHRELMRCQSRMGELSQALRHYQALVELLREEMGSPPAPETAELHRSLLRGEEV
jgi:predicted ATPase/two-component SAPR family response regulator